MNTGHTYVESFQPCFRTVAIASCRTSAPLHGSQLFASDVDGVCSYRRLTDYEPANAS
jgi:hypothetical protein